MDNDLVSKRRAERCSKHWNACDCREYEHAQEIERLRASLESSREVNAKLCQRRDEMDAEIALLNSAIAAYESQYEGIEAERNEMDELRARAERAEGRIADAETAVIAKMPGSAFGVFVLAPEWAGKRVALVVLND